MTLYKASKEWGVPRKTLRRHRDGKVQDPGHLGRGTDIPRSLEDALVNKVKEMERLLFGLTEDVRKIAFEFAQKMGLKTRFPKDTQMAGKDWLYGFLKRHPDLSIRSPEATSMARAVGFNRPQVERFFFNLQGSPRRR